MKHVIAIATMFICTVVPSRQAAAQTLQSQVSADWKALGWTLPESFSPDQIALFKGLNAASGTWSFEAETVDGDTVTALMGNLVTTGSSQGGMASAWNLIWFWPAENPQHAIVENVVAMPEKNERFGLMLIRFGPVKYSEAQLKQKPKARPLSLGVNGMLKNRQSVGPRGACPENRSIRRIRRHRRRQQHFRWWSPPPERSLFGTARTCLLDRSRLRGRQPAQVRRPRYLRSLNT